jgi:hypothetical protein
MLCISHYLVLATNETVPAYIALFGDFFDGGMRPKIDESNCR